MAAVKPGDIFVDDSGRKYVQGAKGEQFDVSKTGVYQKAGPLEDLRYAISKLPGDSGGLLDMVKQFLHSIVNLSEAPATGGQVNPGDVLNVMSGGVEGAGAAGVRGAGIFGARMVTPADVAAKSAARIMDREGRSPKEILAQTGFQKDSRGNLIYELDDSQSKYTSHPTGSLVRLADVLDHPELYARYPELKNVAVEFHEPGGSSGMTNVHRPALEIPEGETIPYITIDHSPGHDAIESHRILMHEVQHAVNSLDAQSGIPRPLGTSEYSAGRDASRLLDRARAIVADSQASPEDKKKYQSLIMRIAREAAGPEAGGMTPSYRLYHVDPGEAEARNTERRLFMSKDQRDLSHATDTEDVFRPDQLDLQDHMAQPGLFTEPDRHTPETVFSVRTPENPGSVPFSWTGGTPHEDVTMELARQQRQAEEALQKRLGSKNQGEGFKITKAED